MNLRIATLTVLGLVGCLFIGEYVLDRQKAVEHPSGAEPTELVAVLSLTGPAAVFDAVKSQSMQLAAERISEKYPDVSLRLKIEDAGSGPDVTTVVAQRAIDGGASAIFSGTSPNALAIAAVVRSSNHVVVQLANAGNPYFGPPKMLEYRLWPDWNDEARIISQILMDQSLATVLLIASADPYSLALADSIERQTNGRITLRTIQFDPASTPDFRPALLKAKADKVSAVVLAGLPPGLQSMLSQLGEIDWTGSIIGGININLADDALASAKLKGLVWCVQPGATSVASPPEGEKAWFRDAYVKRFGAAPAFHAVYAADALYVVAEAVRRGPPLSTAFPQLSEVDAPSGLLHLSPNGIFSYAMAARRLQ